MKVSGQVPFESPLYKAGVSQDDQIVNLGGVDLASQGALDGVLAQHKPGDAVPIRFARRSGETVNATLTFDEDLRIEIVPVEKTGGTLTAAQKAFRDDWLNAKKK